VRILEHALEPLAPSLPPRLHARLHRALSIIYGIEPYVILKDIWGSAGPRGRADRAVDGRSPGRSSSARRQRQRRAACRRPIGPPQEAA
jgi:hypothetical protein